MNQAAEPEGQPDRLSELLARVWHQVVKQVNTLLEAHSKYGTFHFSENLNPSIEDIVKGFEYVDFALNKLLESKAMGHDETRDALNSKQCILKMKELALALDVKDTESVDRLINDLKKQAKL